MSQIYLLDTNIISEVTKREPNPNLIANFEFYNGKCAISSITWVELLSGVYNLNDGRKKQDLLSFLYDYVQPCFPVIPYDSHAASVHGDLMTRLKELGKPAPLLDSQIASIAISNNLILVTHNTKDFECFQKVSNLMMEDWILEK
ncbi:MAG: type II toxin-antitoxin system VapC family toxin [Treponema sp.]|nr:type II toxin-antitoxin system VapC family toxin [Treponema sp.]